MFISWVDTRCTPGESRNKAELIDHLSLPRVCQPFVSKSNKWLTMVLDPPCSRQHAKRKKITIFCCLDCPIFTTPLRPASIRFEVSAAAHTNIHEPCLRSDVSKCGCRCRCPTCAEADVCGKTDARRPGFPPNGPPARVSCAKRNVTGPSQHGHSNHLAHAGAAQAPADIPESMLGTYES